MNRILSTLASVFVLVISSSATQFEVKNVEAHQRYPWNGKVDIDFLIDCADSEAKFIVTVECTDHIGNTNVVMQTIKDNDAGSAAISFKMAGGQHRLVWNADVDCPNIVLANISFAVFAKLWGEEDIADYMIIDLSNGPEATSYPVTYRTGVPAGGWTDVYKTTKLVLRKCPAGTFTNTYYNGGRVTLTKGFFAGVFEVTQKQWELVMGNNPSKPYLGGGVGPTYPVRDVSYDDIRGAAQGSRWPSSSAVDMTSFIYMIRSRTGIEEFDLPTEAQWEHACRAGTTTTYNTGNGESALAAAGWYRGNSDNCFHPVGGKMPNAWGLYDMHGNVSEWVLDWGKASLSGRDPVGAESGEYRGDRGGCWLLEAWYSESSNRSYGSRPSTKGNGFRLFRTLP